MQCNAENAWVNGKWQCCFKLYFPLKKDQMFGFSSSFKLSIFTSPEAREKGSTTSWCCFEIIISLFFRDCRQKNVTSFQMSTSSKREINIVLFFFHPYIFQPRCSAHQMQDDISVIDKAANKQEPIYQSLQKTKAKRAGDNTIKINLVLN